MKTEFLTPDHRRTIEPCLQTRRRHEMTRTLAFCAALLVSEAMVSSASIGSTIQSVDFRLDNASNGRMQLSLVRNDRGHDNMTTSFGASELAGLDAAALSQPGERPIRFALVRQAGRVDCAGNGGNGTARGHCGFTPNPAFATMLESHGIGHPSDDDAYALTVLGATRELVDALEARHYPRPDIEKLIELTAVGVKPQFINELAARGYAPASLNDLVEFAALNISPDYIDGLSRAGYRHLSAEDIGGLKAVGVDPTTIASLAAAGYRDLSVTDLQEMAALHVTPDFIRGFAGVGYANLPVGTLVELKALDVTPDFVRDLQRRGLRPASAEKLAELKAVGIDEAR
jgi:hypothetical protein